MTRRIEDVQRANDVNFVVLTSQVLDAREYARLRGLSIAVISLFNKDRNKFGVPNVAFDASIRTLSFVGALLLGFDSMVFDSSIIEWVEIVLHNEIVEFGDESLCEMGANEYSAAGHERRYYRLRPG